MGFGRTMLARSDPQRICCFGFFKKKDLSQNGMGMAFTKELLKTNLQEIPLLSPTIFFKKNWGEGWTEGWTKKNPIIFLIIGESNQ